MDAPTLIATVKIATDLLAMIAAATPHVTGMTEDEKRALLAQLQGETTAAVNRLYLMATTKNQ